MKTFNAFRPALNAMEERSLMSATFAALPAEPVAERAHPASADWYFLVSQGTPGADLTKGGPGHLILSNANDTAHKGAFEILSFELGAENIVKTLTDAASPATLVSDGAAAADHKGQIEIQSWSFDAPNPTAAKATFKEFTVTKKTDTSSSLIKAGIGTLEFHGVQVEGAANFQRVFGDANGDLANAPETGAMAKAVLYPRKGG